MRKTRKAAYCRDHRSSSRNLSENLLIEILVRLPHKSLARFKCVSRSWRRIISEPHFQARLPFLPMIGLFYQKWDAFHLSEVPGYVSVSTTSSTRDPHELDPNYFDSLDSGLPNYPNLRLMDSRNGLLLLVSRDLPPRPNVNIFVCNPISRKKVSLPDWPGEINLIGVDWFLAFNPKISSSRFCVVRVGYVISGRQQLSVFHYDSDSSSEEGKKKWVDLSVEIPDDRGHVTCGGIVSDDGRILYRVAYPRHLLKIDIQEQSCQEIELPEQIPAWRSHRFRLFYGSNHLIRCALLLRGRGCSQLQIWDLITDSDGKEQGYWVLKQSNCIIEPQIKWRFGGCPGMMKLLAFHSELEEVLFLGFANYIISYSINDQRVEEVTRFAPDYVLNESVTVHPFVPTFI